MCLIWQLTFPLVCVNSKSAFFFWICSFEDWPFSLWMCPFEKWHFTLQSVYLRSNLFFWNVSFKKVTCAVKWVYLTSYFFVMCSFEKSHFIWNVSIWEVTFSFGMCLLVKWPFFAPGLNLSLLLICNWVISHYYYYYTTFSWTCTWTLCSWSTLLHIKWWKEVWDTLLCILMCLHTDYTNPCYQRVWHLHPPSYAKTLFPLLPTIRHPVQLGNYSGYH